MSIKTLLALCLALLCVSCAATRKQGVSGGMGTRMEAIIQDVMALKSQFPQLQHIGAANWRDSSLSYTNGELEVPNLNYEKELVEYPKEKARREAEVAQGIINKYLPLVEPKRTLTRLDERTGARLGIQFTAEDPTRPEEIYQVGVPPMKIYEYQEIGLFHFNNPRPHYRGQVRGQYFQLWIEAGSDAEEERLRNAILDVFLRHQRQK